jgi:hypothetical protein
VSGVDPVERADVIFRPGVSKRLAALSAACRWTAAANVEVSAAGGVAAEGEMRGHPCADATGRPATS